MMMVAIVPTRCATPATLRSRWHDPRPFAPRLRESCAAFDPESKDDRDMRNLVFVALLATAALSMGCNGIHHKRGCQGGGCGNMGSLCGPSGQSGCEACGGGGGRFAGGGCDACGGHGGPGLLGHGGGHGGGAGGGGHQRGMPGVPHHFSREYLGPQGPQAAQVAYPYYTTRGPRDYFANEPATIGY